VINIGSVVARITPPQSAVYTGTKGAVDAITGVLAKELGPRGIRVNALNPGLIETEGTVGAGIIGSEMESSAVQQSPLGRGGKVGDVAKIAVFLASDDSGWLTGEQFLASGGIR
jgi:3-oxoacyl-[acyl-carrier protein] reductase